MKGRSLLMLIVLFCVAAGAHAQKEVTLMNGLVYQYQEIKVDSNWVRFTYLKENKKLKTRILGYEDVFVVTDGKSQTIVYQMNRDTMEIPPYQDMKLFIAGIQSGRKTYNGTRHFIMGATVGLASGIALNSFLAGAPVPVVYTLLQLCSRWRIIILRMIQILQIRTDLVKSASTKECVLLQP